ncbi:hypothetical protein K0M31_001026 [Melipona bicolor]|uniref:Uncharacterized protein n=1 Tax=Melipona bicolor TaxID=60889 RepID=A0AA40KXB3_9HYME|nr:hypothetical protein K0M31_001026 [Melipona bicolor]
MAGGGDAAGRVWLLVPGADMCTGKRRKLRPSDFKGNYRKFRKEPKRISEYRILPGILKHVLIARLRNFHLRVAQMKKNTNCEKFRKEKKFRKAPKFTTTKNIEIR